MTADLRQIVIFGHFTNLHIFHPNEQIFTFQVHSFGDFHEFERLFGKSKKLHFSSPKWAYIYISSVLWSTDGGFHHFKRLFEESKKLKILTVENEQICIYISKLWFSSIWKFLSKKLKIDGQIVIFGHFTNLHIFQPNEQIFTFQVSCSQLVVIFIGICDKLSFLGISQTCIFFIQMNKSLQSVL